MRSTLARKIESAFLDPRRPAHRTSFSVAASGARVHVRLQQQVDSTRLIALCPSNLRAAVGRALEEARYALALRGIRLSVTVEEA